MLILGHTFYSHTYGTISTKELVAQAAALGYGVLPLTDINNTCTILDFYDACQEAGIRPIAGIDFRNKEENADIVYIGLAQNNKGFHELNAHLSAHLHSKEPFPARAPAFEDVIVIYPFRPDKNCFNGLRENEYIGIRPQDIPLLLGMPESILRRKAVAMQPVSYKEPGEYYLHCLLRSIDKNVLLSRLDQQDAAPRNEHWITPAKYQELYRYHPYLLINAEKVLECCEISFDFATSKNKQSFNKTQREDAKQLRTMCYKGLRERYKHADKTTWDEAVDRLDKELDVIVDMQFTGYFLMAYDVVRYAKSKGYFHAGRGSGANSIAAYSLEITEVDPIALNLYFERFLNMHRSSPPDFDIDFSWKDKDDIIEYLFKTHGHKYTAALGSHSTLKFRAATRELGKVYGLPKDEIDDLIDNAILERQTKVSRNASKMDIFRYKMLTYGDKLTKFPRHLSMHASGIVISQQPLFDFTATDLPPKGFPITHFDMYTADKFKLYKLDILSQRGLGHIKDCIRLVKENRGEDIDITQIKQFTENEHLNRLLKEGDTIGCFYIESPAMRQLLKKLQCGNFNTLVAASSIIRPGVSDSGMMRTYIQRSREPDKYKPSHPTIGKILGETFGVMVYQEDIIKVAHEFAGLPLARADILRRAMAWKFRVDNGFDQLEKDYYDNCRALGYPEHVIDEIWRQMEGFAGFSFCKAHSASYAVESYQSLFLKTYYPLEFMVAVINNFGGYYNTEFYVNELRRAGGILHAPCVNRGQYLTHIEGIDVFLGLIHIKSLENELANSIIPEREAHGPYKSLADFCERLKPGLEQMFILIRIGAFRFTGQSKRQLLWEACLLFRHKKPNNGMEALFPQPTKKIQLPPLPQSFKDDALEEIELLGFPLCSRFLLTKEQVVGDIKARDLINNVGHTVTVVGYLTNSKHKKTVKGDYMQFGSFLDDEGYTFEAVLFPNVFKEYPLTHKGVYALTGKVTEEYDVTTLELKSWKLLEISFKNTENDYAVIEKRGGERRGNRVIAIG
jgi:DNA polymerase-3 subunit alpha